MKHLLSILLIFALFWSSVCALQNAAAVEGRSETVGLRYREPLSGETVKTAREKQPGLTFWCEETISLSTEWRRVQTEALLFWGDAALVWGQSCMSGSLPSEFDMGGCALSTGLAHALFGSDDVTDLAVSWEETVYTVRGVWEDTEPMILLPAQHGSFTAVEVPECDAAEQDPSGWIETIRSQSGLPEPDWCLFPAIPTALTWVFSMIPLLFGGGVLLWAAAKRLSECSFPTRDAAIFVVCTAAALALPLFLAAWPQWLTPSRWSDFAWWQRTGQQLCKQAEAWLAVPGVGRDLAVKAGLCTHTAFAACQCVVCEVLRCRFRTSASGTLKKQEL